MNPRDRWSATIAGGAVVLVTAGPLLPTLGALALRVSRGGAPILLAGPSLWGRTLVLALLSATLAGAVGVGQALWIVGGRSKSRRLARSLYLLPLLLPPYLTALTWMVLAGREGVLAHLLGFLGGPAPSPFGLTGAVLVLGLTAAPAVAWLCLRALEDLESEPVEAALLGGGPSAAWRGVVFPALAGPAAAGAGLAFALALSEYGVPSLLQWAVASQEVYAEFSRSGSAAAATGFALPALLPALLAAAAVAASGRVPAGRRAGEGALFVPTSLPQPAVLRIWGWVGVTAGAAAILLPPFVLSAQAAGGAGGFAEIASARGAILYSLAQCGAAGILAAAGGALLAPALFRAGGRWVSALCLAPLAVPSPLFGLGLQGLVSRPGLSWMGDGPLLLVAGHAMRFLPVALLAIFDGLRRQDQALWEATALLNTGSLNRWLGVLLPLQWPSLWTAAGLVAALSMGEIGVSLSLTPPGGQTVSLRLYNLLHYGADARVAALALATALAAALTGLAVWAFVRRRSP